MKTGHHLVFFMTFLMICSTASRSEGLVFVQTGQSVKLEISKTLPGFSKLTWIKDSNENIVRFFNNSKKINYHSLYKERAEFNNQTFSLTLKNMQKNNSGNYTAKASGEKETVVAAYDVSVIDAVDSPVLHEKSIMISVNSCFVDVSCSAHTLQLNNRYYSDNCSQEEVTSSEMQTLTLYCIENVVVCNYSNPVSWKNATIEMNQLCTSHQASNNSNSTSPSQPPETQHSSFPLHWLLVIAAGVAMVVFVAVSVTFWISQKHKKEDQVTDHTIYAQVKPKNKVKSPHEMLEKSENPQTVYGFAGEHKQTHDTSQTITTHEAQTTIENPPCTTYSTIGEHQTPALPTESENTIYSVVTKPQRGRPPVHK
ncbi:natural killer cell receptor 2B4-like [Danio aesculapii]|uniref:natural killer cell receptor 2B4-like n=1 Tax=Danio aesculapii TaxID=1142201 RepID=UPI0024C02D32|nr:natural killer cell receptor 2B4-like [Danio aesculapii]